MDTDFLKYLLQADVLLPLFVGLTALSSVVGYNIYRIQKLKFSNGKVPDRQLNEEILKAIKLSLEDNAALKERVKNLESIVTSLGTEVKDSRLLKEK